MRTTHQEAKYIVDEYSKILVPWEDNYEAKQCAILAVKQMQRVMVSLWEKVGINENSRSVYLDDIINEIKKL
jgi:hypothetical protein